MKNPYTNSNIVLATRLDYDDFTNALSLSESKRNAGAWWNKTYKTAAWGKKVKTVEEEETTKTYNTYGYLFMLGLPHCHTGLKNTKKLYEENSWR
jgi:hypothetical protein